jgi:hypothetical protein
MRKNSYLLDYSENKKTITRQNTDFQINRTIENLKFIHVGKCSGTSVLYYLNANGVDIDEYHRKQPPNLSPFLYFIWIRNPIKRFISAFNHSKSIIDFDIKGIEGNEILTLDNCPAPSKIERKINTGYAFNPTYDNLVSEFHSANELAECLSSRNSSLRLRAQDLMNRPEEHIFKGIGWHLNYGNFLRNSKDKIIQVGTTENFNADLHSLCKKLRVDFDPTAITWTRKSSSKSNIELSTLALKNLTQFYKSDFKCLKKLKRLRLLNEATYNTLHTTF